MPTSATDSIAQQTLIKAPRARVWQALTDATEFGSWFGVVLTGPFVPGQPSLGHITNEGYTHLLWEAIIVEMDPERRFSWTWHPYAVDTTRDYTAETPTLVTFLLQDAPDGVLLTVVESGFDALPEDRRTEAYPKNVDGWIWEMNAITQHLAK